MPPPKVPALQNGTLPIPSTRPAPTFQVFIPTGNTVTKGDKVALLLNTRVVWEGDVDPNVPVEVAYAALNLGPDGNKLVFVTRTTLQQSVPAGGANGFPTSGGPPQTLPDTGGIGPTLPAPRVVVKNAPTIGPGDILDEGLEIDVPPYGAAVGDLVTVYCYLSGKDVLTGMQANNIVPLIYSVQEGSPLISGNKVPVYLPQWAVAGYALGEPPIVNFLQVDYKVVSQTRQPSPRWSSLSPTFTLNTTI